MYPILLLNEKCLGYAIAFPVQPSLRNYYLNTTNLRSMHLFQLKWWETFLLAFWRSKRGPTMMFLVFSNI